MGGKETIKRFEEGENIQDFAKLLACGRKS